MLMVLTSWQGYHLCLKECMGTLKAKIMKRNAEERAK